jgi:tyrosyl-tRNA synthetase
MQIDTNSQKIEHLLSNGVENIYPTKEFLKKQLESGKQLTLYTGYDPTSPTLHIGHGITMLKLREFQDLGHKIIMLIGDFTGMIGDPTDKTSARQQLTREQVLENCKEYKKQAARILNFEGENPVEVKFNSEWLSTMTFADVVELSSHFTVQQMLERDMFEKRMSYSVFCPKCKQDNFFPISAVLLAQNELPNWKIDTNSVHVQCTLCGLDLWDKAVSIISPNSKPIYIHEFLYPLMQGYDSVAMDVDGEIGGNDQTFNMLAGRILMKEIKQKEKFVLTTKLLADDTGKKMSKTEGNMIALSDTPEDMFGKVMRWSDGMIKNGFDLCTTLTDAVWTG